MKFFVKDEKGSTLLLVLLMVLIFTVLGMVLISSTLSGTKRTIHRESDVQATAMAEMGIDYVSGFIEAELNKRKNEDGEIEFAETDKDIDELFQELLEEIVAELTLLYSEDGQKYDIKDLVVDLNEVDGRIDGTISFVSIGEVNGVTKTLSNVLSLGAGGEFNVLSYAVGAEGNVYLHGSPTITGDLYVGNNLYVYDRAHVFSGQDYYIPSANPCIQSNRSIVGNEIKKINRIENYQNHIRGLDSGSYSPAPNQNANDQAFLQTVFGCAPVPTIDNTQTEFSPIDIEGAKGRFKVLEPQRTPSFTTYCLRTNWFGSCVERTDLFRNNYSQLLVRPNIANNSSSLYFNATHTIGAIHSTEKVYIRDGTDLTLGWHDSITETFKGGMYVDGDLYIGNPNTNSNDNDIDNYENISIKGPIFVNGNLFIRGADVQFDSTVYVTGETEIRNSRLRGIQNNNIESSLVLFGEREVKISNISSFENNRDLISKVRGFFYSNSLLEMYGVGSNIEIEGGIFGQDIVLNAIRGDSYDQPFKHYYQPGSVGWYFEPSNSQKRMDPSKSRLRIKHNADLIKNPPDALPVVDNIEFTISQREVQ